MADSLLHVRGGLCYLPRPRRHSGAAVPLEHGTHRFSRRAEPAPTVTQLAGVAENLKGSWLIFMPFGPCLLYALTRHWQQARKEKAD